MRRIEEEGAKNRYVQVVRQTVKANVNSTLEDADALAATRSPRRAGTRSLRGDKML